jgi:hypothetical protein
LCAWVGAEEATDVEGGLEAVDDAAAAGGVGEQGGAIVDLGVGAVQRLRQVGILGVGLEEPAGGGVVFAGEVVVQAGGLVEVLAGEAQLQGGGARGCWLRRSGCPRAPGRSSTGSRRWRLSC